MCVRLHSNELNRMDESFDSSLLIGNKREGEKNAPKQNKT